MATRRLQQPLIVCASLLLCCTLAPAQSPKLGLAPKGFDTKRDNVPHGKIESIEYDSKTVGRKRKMVVYTPPGFDKASKYPVLYLLHGLNFDETGWQVNGSANIILDNLHADKKIVPMIVVMPNGFASKGGGKKDTANFEDDLLKDIVPYIESHYSVKAERESRALFGQSMGGGQALRIGLKHLDQFASVGGLSPAIGNAKLITYPDDTAKKLRFFWLSCGDKDGLLSTLEAFHRDLETSKVPHVWHVGEGAHNFTVWKNDLYLLAPLLFRETAK